MPDAGSVLAVLGLCVYPHFGMRSGCRDWFQKVGMHSGAYFTLE